MTKLKAQLDMLMKLLQVRQESQRQNSMRRLKLFVIHKGFKRKFLKAKELGKQRMRILMKVWMEEEELKVVKLVKGVVHSSKPLLKDKGRRLLEILMGCEKSPKQQEVLLTEGKEKNPCVFKTNNLCVDVGFVRKEDEKILKALADRRHGHFLQREKKI